MSSIPTEHRVPSVLLPAITVMLSAVLCGCQQPRQESRASHEPMPVEWYRPTERPCLSLGDEGAFDSKHLFAPCVYRWENEFRMLYCGSPAEPATRLFSIGMARSDDGVGWDRLCGRCGDGHDGHEPVLAFGDGRTSLVTPALVRTGPGWVDDRDGKLRMCVIAVDFAGDRTHWLYTTSSGDGGMTWSPLVGPLMKDVYAPSVLLVDGTYRMWYVDVSAEPWCIRVASSGDGIEWTRENEDPVLVIDQEWERGNLFYPYVIHDRGRYLMWYGSYWANRQDHTAIGLAISEDGIHWSKYADNPVIRPDDHRPFESNYCTSHTVLPLHFREEGRLVAARDTFLGSVFDGYQIWYATRNQDTREHKYFAIGTATAGTLPDLLDIEEWRIVAGPEFSLSAERANDTRLQPLHYLNRYGQETHPSHAFTATTKAEWRTWREELRVRLTELIGLDVIERANPLLTIEPRDMRVVAGPVDTFKDYTRHAFTIETAPGLWVPAFLLIPDGLDEPRPAILCAHGHGIGMNALVGLTEEGNPRQYRQGYQHDFALQAVKAGFVTLAFEEMGFGRRRDIDFNKAQKLWNQCEQPSKNALHWGMTMTGLRVWDAMRMIDFLQSRPEVLPDRIGMVGISGGGLVTQFTAALDDRVKAACVSGFLNRFSDCIPAIHHCIDNYVPGLGQVADNDDVACLIAPRPLLVEAGKQDPIFPIAATRAAIRKVRRCYELLDATQNLEKDIFDGPHEFSGAKTWTFFEKHLGAPQ